MEPRFSIGVPAVLALLAVLAALSFSTFGATDDDTRPPLLRLEPGRFQQCALFENEYAVEAVAETVCALLDSDCKLECRAAVDRGFGENFQACLRGEREPGPWLVVAGWEET